VTRDYTLKRALINVDMVKDINNRREFPLGEDKIGYVRLTQFGDKTSGDLDAALRKLKAQGMRALILDLRWNPGGLLEQAVDVCQKFLPRGQLVVSTEGRSRAQSRTHRARGRGDQLDGMPMVVLVNLGSASASEIVAGCLRILKRAIIWANRPSAKVRCKASFRWRTAPLAPDHGQILHPPATRSFTSAASCRDINRDAHGRRGTRSPAQTHAGGVESLAENERERVRQARDPQLDRATDLLERHQPFHQRAPAGFEVGRAPRGLAAKEAKSARAVEGPARMGVRKIARPLPGVCRMLPFRTIPNLSRPSPALESTRRHLTHLRIFLCPAP
jgi:carboxyl-terminal processing protease